MKTRIIAAVILSFLITSAAHAANYCSNWGSAPVAAIGLLPVAKGTCKPFNGLVPGLVLLAGDACGSSDGKTVFFNTFTQFGVGTDTLAGSYNIKTGIGSGTECPHTGGCVSFSVTNVKCPKHIIIPSGVTAGESKPSSGFLTQP